MRTVSPTLKCGFVCFLFLSIFGYSIFRTSFSFDFSDNINAPDVTYGYEVNDASNYNLSDGRLRATDVVRENDTLKLDTTYLGEDLTIKMGFAYNDRVVSYSG